MKGIKLDTIDGDRVVKYVTPEGTHILKTFSKYDDFAFTNARSFASQLTKYTKEEFQDRYPQFFL